MHTNLIERFNTLAGQETSIERNKRMLPGIAYGLIIASSYALMGGVANLITFRNLPIGVDWGYILPIWLFFSAWLGLGSGFINWFTQNEESFIPGFIFMTMGALGASAFLVEGDPLTQTGKILLIVMPILAISLLMTFSLRWLGEGHAKTLEKEKAMRTIGIVILILSALIIGGLAGYGLNRWSDTILGGVRDMHNRLQTINADPSQTGMLFHLNEVPQLEKHLTAPYTLYAHSSGEVVVGSVVTVNFRDGYRITCLFLVFPDKTPFLRNCTEGTKIVVSETQ